MSIVSAICNSFKVEMGQAIHDFTASTGDTFKCALYTEAASLGKDTVAYTTTGEATGTNYTAGGEDLTSVTPTVSSDVAIYDFADQVFSNLTVAGIRGALIYNSSKADRAVCVLRFDQALSPVTQDLTVTFPSPTPTTAILRNR